MLRHTHIFTYDESQATNFIFDKPEDKQGLYKACKFINHDINKSLKDVVFMSSFTADNILFDFIGQKETEGESRKNIIKACSEALVYAVAKCYVGHGLCFWRRRAFGLPNCYVDAHAPSVANLTCSALERPRADGRTWPTTG